MTDLAPTGTRPLGAFEASDVPEVATRSRPVGQPDRAGDVVPRKGGSNPGAGEPVRDTAHERMGHG